MKVLVTGATGFIGNHVVQHLIELGVNVIATSSDLKKASCFTWFSQVTYRELDLAGASLTENYFTYFGEPDAVIHLAWEGLPNYKSLFHFEENLPRHYFFLKNLIINGCKNITAAGTCFEYGMQDGELTETMCGVPDNSYAVAKDSLNRFLCELAKSYPVNLKWIRLFYLYGQGQNPKSLFSQLDMAIQKGEKVFNMSGGEQIRDYLPIESASQYIAKIAMQDQITGIINCCSGIPVKIKDLVVRYLDENKKSIGLNFGFYPYPDYEPMAFWGNNKKLQSLLHG